MVTDVGFWFGEHQPPDVEWPESHRACGKRNIRQTLVKAEFIEGGTIGLAPATRR